MDSYGNSLSFQFTNRRQFGRNPHQIPWSMTIPCHLSRFYLFSIPEHDLEFTKVQVMEFTWHLLRKWWDFHRICLIFEPNQTAVKSKRRKNPCHIFYRVYFWYLSPRQVKCIEWKWKEKVYYYYKRGKEGEKNVKGEKERKTGNH